MGADRDVLGLFAGSPSTIRFADGEVTTGRRLAADGARVAGWLTAAGNARGDRVAVRLGNRADHVRLLLGCAVGGFVAVPVNTRLTDAEAAELTARSGARVIDPDELANGEWRGHAPLEPVGGRGDPFVVFTTSGTTNRPKLVLHRQASIADHAHDVAAGFGYTSDDVVLVVMPLCGTFGLTSLTAAVAGGGHVVVADFDLAATAALIADHRVTCVNGSDDMFHRLLEHGADLSTLRLAGYARFNTSLDGIVERGETAGAVLTGLYGMSEVQALFSLRDPGSSTGLRARAGGTLVAPGAAYRVVDGELRLRGPSLFAGYLVEGGERIDEQLTAAAFDGEWFRTGDLARSEDDRTFEYLGRMGDALRLGGFLVDPSEIESVLLEVAGVAAAQVVAVDRPGGVRPVAFVVAPGGFDEAAAITACAGRLARFKVPVRVLAVDGFPTTASPNGTKIRRSELRRLAGEALEHDANR